MTDRSTFIPKNVKSTKTENRTRPDCDTDDYSSELSTFSNILQSMKTVGKTECPKILVMSCGYENLLRHLQSEFPAASVTVGAIDKESVDFCVETFGANGLCLTRDRLPAALTTSYDFIWCDAWFSHLDLPLWHEWLVLFNRHLNNSGQLVFSFYGRQYLRRLLRGTENFGLSPEQSLDIIRNYENTGFGYAECPGEGGCGISVASPAWVVSQLQAYPNVRINGLVESGVDADPDVVSCVRIADVSVEPAAVQPSVGHAPPYRCQTGLDRLSCIYLNDAIGQHTASFNATVHDDDEMYLFLKEYSGVQQEHVMWNYLQSGKEMADVIQQIIDWGFDGFEQVTTFLDFACGYGRFTRFLVGLLPPERIWVSDIYTDAVKFQETQFGVRGIVSAETPEAYRNDNRFDCIFVASLFSHLPPKTFTGWLARLYELLSPKGLLLFSVHGESVMSKEYTMGVDGITFVPQSESRSLDTDSYGSTYVTEAYVGRAIAEISGHQAEYFRIPKGLWNFQDLYVVSRKGDRDFLSLNVHLGPCGGLDECISNEKEKYCFRGWAADLGDDAWIKDVQILVNGKRIHRCLPLYERPDIVAHYDNEKARCAGWSARIDQNLFTPPDVVMVKCISNTGLERVIWLGTFDSLVNSRLYSGEKS